MASAGHEYDAGHVLCASLSALDAHGDSHTAPDAQGREPRSRVAFVHFEQERGQNTRPRGADGDDAAIDINPARFEAEILFDGAGRGLRSKGSRESAASSSVRHIAVAAHKTHDDFGQRPLVGQTERGHVPPETPPRSKSQPFFGTFEKQVTCDQRESALPVPVHDNTEPTEHDKIKSVLNE